MGNSINEEYFNCIAEDNINNKTINIIINAILISDMVQKKFFMLFVPYQ